jgi:hypothetical protein
VSGKTLAGLEMEQHFSATDSRRRHPFLEELGQSVAAVVPHEPVDFVGSWAAATRRTYETRAQTGTGRGPFREVIDSRWEGTLTGLGPVAGIAFMAIGADLFWAKSTPAPPTLPVNVSFHAYAQYSDNRATFAGSLGGAQLPGAPVVCGADVLSACTLGESRLSTGLVELIAHVDRVDFLALLIPGRLLKVGRNRLWRVRSEVASSLPPPVAEILTRSRSGSIRSG